MTTLDWVSELPPLLERLVDGEFTCEDWARLNEFLSQGDQPRRYYHRYMKVHAALEWRNGGQNEAEAAKRWIPSVTAQLPSLPASPQSAVDFQILPSAGMFGSAYHGGVGYFSSGWPVAYLVATVIFGIGVLIGSLVHVSLPAQVAKQSSVPSRVDAEPKTELVGQITGMVNCQWADRATEASNGARVPLGRKYALASGLMEITYDTGAKVILQGPVTYEMEANGGYLSVGKLTGKLDTERGGRGTGEESSLHPSSFILHPFVIRTPTAVVTDLGTEFGVEVDKQGVTTSHVFRGSVRLVVDTCDGKTQEVAQVLHENESARVENRGSRNGGNRIVMLAPSAHPANFVRQISRQTVKVFDLVDVVAGGDGFSGRRGAGIDPTNGRVALRHPPFQGEKDWLVGDGKYHRVEGLPFVDGVFIPDGRLGPVYTDSAGHLFPWVPKTANQTPSYVWAGGVIPTEPPDTTQAKLGEVNYASPDHAMLWLHANKGITFNLEAIRRANPGYKLLRFRATAGNTEPFSATGAAVYADLWVLVDGQERFKRREICRYNGAFAIAIPIGEKDRFLTLAATDGGNGIIGDCILFGDPRLELLPLQQTMSK